LKKQKNVKKLEVHRETLTELGFVTGGSQIWDTVYHPPKKDPFTGPIVIA
jgi:hypothetical protein